MYDGNDAALANIFQSPLFDSRHIRLALQGTPRCRREPLGHATSFATESKSSAKKNSWKCT
jgi:hypothetical protein